MYKPIYAPKNRAKEYCDLALNIYTGCPHGCTYCYVPLIKHITRTIFKCEIAPRPNIIEATERQLSTESFKDKTIMLCFTCDPYPIGHNTYMTRAIIKLIKDAGAHVQILTKGGLLALRDFDLLDRNDYVGVTITGFEVSRKEYEPGAAPNKERLELLNYAKQRNIKTWLSAEPPIDFNPIYDLIKNFDFIDMYRIGKMNHIPWKANWHEFGYECIRLCEEYNRNYYIKEDLRQEL